jgi:4-hydroxybenzoate-CoA ligase/benzoate-CoA ligase
MTTPRLTPLPSEFNAASFFVDRHVAEGRGARVVFRVPGEAPVTYGDLSARVSRAGNALAGVGVEIEHRVLLALNDSPDFAAVFWGAIKLGAVVIPVNTLMSADEYAFLLQDSRARVAVVDESVAPRILAVRARCPFLRAVIVAGSAPAGADRLADRLANAGPVLTAAPTVGEDVMYWGYTSGSTGRPKAVVHSHADFVAAADLVGVGVFGLGPDDLTFSASKMSFAFGLGNSLFFPAHVGAASLLVAERADPERVFDIISRERPTVFFTVPTLYARLLLVEDAARRFDLSSLRMCVSSGEALPPALFDAWRARFGHDLMDVVGSTETLHDFIASRPGAVRRGSAGRVVPGFEVRLVDADGRDVPDGTVGAVLVKGPTNALYYWNRRERTEATMQGEWLRTGDMMSRDADGYFSFAGRADDMLKVAGQWVSPAEVEARLMDHPAVLEAAVVARADGDGLFVPHAVLVAKEGHEPSRALAHDIRAFARAGLPSFKVPRTVEFAPELPRTATGKIQRFRLRAP